MQSGNLRYPPVRFMRIIEPSPNSLNRSSKRLEMMVSKQTTRVAAVSSRLEWRIDHFEKLMKLMKNGQNLISKQFACSTCPSVIWELHVYPNGKREEDVNNVSFFLRQVGLQRGEDPVMTEFQIYALDASDCRISVCRDTKDFSNQQGRGKFQVQRDKMLTALRPDGSLLLFCEVEFLPPGIKLNVEKEDDEIVEETNLDSSVWVQESLREMWQQETFTDCIIQVGSARMNAHRCILAQHSVVFRSMFAQKSMLEAQNGQISITDSRPEYVRAMLQFIYTGSVDKSALENFAEGILAIADKYAVMPLKEQCERYMTSIICAKNIANLCLIADTYFGSYLKKACIKYISSNHKTFLRSPEWKELKAVRGQLANELLEAVLDQNGSEGIDLSSSFEGGGTTEPITVGGAASTGVSGGGGTSGSSLTPASLYGVGVFSPSSNISRNNSTSALASFSLNTSGGTSTSSSLPSVSNSTAASSSLICASQPSQSIKMPALPLFTYTDTLFRFSFPRVSSRYHRDPT
uniref:BTB domain-containing protein n=1 Tax=Meloidogyne javanica TaxID=6303 RepID=A0A915LTV1_MELJA